jgi:multisubunit Na+/H+ antiporter MnhC subunit
MQAMGSFTLIGTFIGIALLAMAFAVTIGAPIVGLPIIILGIGAFLVWRGKRRAATTLPGGYRGALDRVPSTEEAAADPVRDSGVAEATASGTPGRHRTDVPDV